MGRIFVFRLSVVCLRNQETHKTIYMACIGWIMFDAAVVIVVIVQRV
jgi:hypothetical protein